MKGKFEAIKEFLLNELLSAKEEVNEEFEGIFEGNDPRCSQEAVSNIFEHLISVLENSNSYTHPSFDELEWETPDGYHIGETVLFIGTTYSPRRSLISSFELDDSATIGEFEIRRNAEATIVGYRPKECTDTVNDVYLIQSDGIYFFVNAEDLEKI